jgi:E2/UBC family protein E
MELRRQFELLPEDTRFLDDYGLPWETVVDGSRWVLIHDFPTHDGYVELKATAAIRLETGYPMTALDMVYFCPPINRKDGKPIPQTNASQKIDGKSFQRWSRHRSGKNPWRPGEDGLESHILLVADWLAREFEK